MPGVLRRAGGRGRPSATRTAAPIVRADVLKGQSPPGEPLPVWIGETGGFTEIAAPNTGAGGAYLATRWTLESRYGNCTVRKLGTFAANATGSLRLGIYTSTGTAPGTLVSETGSVAVANGRTSYDVTAPASIAPGEYWLVAQVESNAVGLASHGTASSATKSRYLDGTYGALPSTFPGGSSAQELTRYIFAELTADAITKPAATSPPGSPPTLSGPSGKSLTGYTLAFNDEFDFLDRSKWQQHIFWNYESPPNSIYCTDSILHLDSRASDGYPDVYMDTLGIQDDWQYGYYECYMIWTHGTAAWPAFWLYSSNWSKVPEAATCSSFLAGELDVMEAWGPSPAINETTSINSFAGTVHKDTSGVCGDNIVGPAGGNNYRDLSPTVLGGNWHTYGMLWEPTKVTWYIDNAETHSATVGAGTDWASLDQDMHIILYSWPEGSEFGHPGVPADETSPDPLDVKVDWVRVWQAA